jgi:hypothetical protein
MFSRSRQGCTVTTPIGEQCPIIWVMDFKDIETIFSRLGLREMIDEHAETQKNAAARR